MITYLNDTTQISEYDNKSVTLAWKANDSSPYQYIIYVNGTSVVTDTWQNHETIAYVFSSTAGTYNITISFSDKVGLMSSHTVIVTLIHSASTQNTGSSGVSGEEGSAPSADNTWIIIIVVIVAVVGIIAVYLLKIKKSH